MSSAVGFPSKSGGVSLEDYTTNGMILEFGPIAASLQTEFDKSGSNPVLEARHITELVASIINFQEKHCGLNSPRPPPFTRFPFDVFRDYKLHGHLHRLLRFMISYCVKQKWYIENYIMNEGKTSRLLIDLKDETLIKHYCIMFKHIENQLKKQQIIKPKIIYFSPLISVNSQQKLAQIARNHGAKISDQNMENVTHIILRNNVDMEDSGEEHVRTVDKCDNLAYIHYWFYPTSYDQWISNDLIDGDAENILPPSGAWRVGERFLTDLCRFNEWMVELDYEVLDDNTPEAYINTDSTIGNGNNVNPRKRKRDLNDRIVIDDDDADGDWVPPTKKAKTGEYIEKKTLKFTLKRGLNPSQHITSSSTVKRSISLSKKGVSPSLNGGDLFPYCGSSLSRIRPMISSYPIVIPYYARWFRLDGIHAIEYESLYGLFVDKSMQYHERYMDIRNFMVNSYRINPRIYLTVTASRRIIAADAGSVYRIHKFLSHWGLINYQCDDGSIPEFEPVMMDYTHIETPFGTKTALKRNNNNDNMFCVPHIFNNDILCVFCGINCAESRYRCNIENDLILCCSCFESALYSMIFVCNDFFMELGAISLNKACLINDNNINICLWSDDEIKKLKYAIKTWNDDWKCVSQYVGRNEEECIAQFIQLPITDTFIDNVETNYVINNNHQNINMLSFLNENNNINKSPFNDVSHPILAISASLSAIVDQELVNCAKKSIKDELKAKPSAILGLSAVIAKALKSHKDQNIDQLLQHLVLLQSQKVKAKMANLEQLHNILKEEKKEIILMKQELIRDRIEIAKQRLNINDDGDDDDDDQRDDVDVDIK